MAPNAVLRSPGASVLAALSAPRLTPQKIAVMVTKDPRQVRQLFIGIESTLSRTRFTSATVLRLTSELAPHLIYPYFQRIVRLLDSENAILRWQATRILADLAPVDHEERIEKMLDSYMEPVTGHEMIGAATCIQSAARIALVKPHLADRIAGHILNVERASYKRPECRNVAIGHAIAALDRIFRELDRTQVDTIEFVIRQLQNPRPATRRKAEGFLKKWQSKSVAPSP